MLDLFCGRLGWSRAFVSHGWECIGVDLVEPPEVLTGCEFVKCDILQMSALHGRVGVNAQLFGWLQSWKFDFICASSPCEEFSVHGMKHFHPNPKYPEMGIKLFNHTRHLCEASGLPYVMENVKPAQRFVGQARARAGSFYLWGSGVPALIPQGLVKGASQMRRDGRFRRRRGVDELMYMGKDERAEKLATIPSELSNCVADYAERICVPAPAGMEEGT